MVLPPPGMPDQMLRGVHFSCLLPEVLCQQSSGRQYRTLCAVNPFGDLMQDAWCKGAETAPRWARSHNWRGSGDCDSPVPRACLPEIHSAGGPFPSPTFLCACACPSSLALEYGQFSMYLTICLCTTSVQRSVRVSTVIMKQVATPVRRSTRTRAEAPDVDEVLRAAHFRFVPPGCHVSPAALDSPAQDAASAAPVQHTTPAGSASAGECTPAVGVIENTGAKADMLQFLMTHSYFFGS